MTTKRASSPRSSPPLLPLPSWIPPSRVRWAVWALSTAADSQLGPAGGRSSRSTTSWSTSSSSASFRALPSGVSLSVAGLLETRRAARAGWSARRRGRRGARVLPERDQVAGRSSASGRPTRTWYVPGTRSRPPACARARTRPRTRSPPPAATGPRAGTSGRVPAPRGACRSAARKVRRERVRAHDVPGIDPQHGAKRVVEASRRRCALSAMPRMSWASPKVFHRSASGGSRSSSRQGLVQQCERVGDPVVVEEVLGGGRPVGAPRRACGWAEGRRAPGTARRARSCGPTRSASRSSNGARTGGGPDPDSHPGRPAPSGVWPPHPRRRAPLRASRRESKPREPPSASTPASPGMQLAKG